MKPGAVAGGLISKTGALPNGSFGGEEKYIAMRALILTLVLFGFVTTAWPAEWPADGIVLPVTIEKSGSEEVDALVLQLVSKRPAPYPTRYYSAMYADDYMTREVEDAIDKLRDMGTSIFPALVMHIRDDRYSFSRDMNGWVNRTVGDAIIIFILSEGTEFSPWFYPGRKSPSGDVNPPKFRDYVEDHNREKWGEWAKNKTHSEIQVDFIQWCFAKEKERGFVDDAQRKKIVEAYEQAIAEAKAK